jgi:hypothetical protein
VWRDAGGRISEACVDAAHGEYIAIAGDYRDWYYSPGASRVRAMTLAGLPA